MAYDVSPYLLLPCRDLATACRQKRHARGVLVAPCGACPLSDMCKSPEAQAAYSLPPSVARYPDRAVGYALRRKDAA